MAGRNHGSGLLDAYPNPFKLNKNTDAGRKIKVCIGCLIRSKNRQDIIEIDTKSKVCYVQFMIY